MFNTISRLLKSFQQNNKSIDSTEQGSCESKTIPISVLKLKQELQETFHNTSDLVIREVNLGKKQGKKTLIICIDGMIDKQIVSKNIVAPLLNLTNDKEIDLDILKNTISNSSLKEINSLDAIVDNILSGYTVVCLDGYDTALSAMTEGWKARSVEEPNTETIISGPREGFVETLRTNTSLLRRKIKNPNLKFESIKLGVQTKTEVCIGYIQGIADNTIVDEVKRRLNSIKIDGILDSGYINQIIKDKPFSLFETIGESERPDKVAGKLLEGRVAIIVDGSPVILTVPHVFIEVLQSSEDYFINPYFATALRFIRFTALLITLMLPAIYVGLLSFHQSIIPFKLMLTILGAREGIPFTPFIEALIMTIIFEILREASVRIAKNVGQAVSIAGAIVLGEAAYSAGIASTLMIIVISLTAISSFVSPPLTGQVIILRYIFLIAANVLGFMGIALVISIIVIYLCSAESFGICYLYPIVPINLQGLKDSLIYTPRLYMNKLPHAFVDKPQDSLIRTLTKNSAKEEE